MRKASEVIEFPYGSKSVCLIEQVKDGALKQIHYAQEKKDAYYNAKKGDSRLFAVWPGQWTSDLFEIDDIEAYGRTFIKSLRIEK